MSMTIKTNNRPRPLLSMWELTDKERKEVDYVDEQDGGCRFVRYKGGILDVCEYMRIDRGIAPHPQREGWEMWHGYTSDSFFSGTLIRYCEDTDYVVVATYIC